MELGAAVVSDSEESSDSDESLCEEEVVEEGFSEIILVPTRSGIVSEPAWYLDAEYEHLIA